MARVRFENVSKTFRPTRQAEVTALRELTLEVADRECLAVLGPSGSGKTTLLRILAGLESASDGDLRIGDRSVRIDPPERRNVAMVFQNHALYPQLNVLENLVLGLRIRRVERREAERRARDMAGQFGLDAMLQRQPSELSGGERQRVALGRALLREPDVLLLDEPLSSLDPALRRELRLEISRAQRRAALTTLYVTHDQEEAMAVADRIAVLQAGRLHQAAAPMDLYRRPADTFVAGFVGAPGLNLWQGCLCSHADSMVFEFAVRRGPGLRVPLPAECSPAVTGILDKEVVLGARPEALMLRHDAEPGAAENDLRARIERVERLGADTLLHFTLGEQRGVLRCRGEPAVNDGQSIFLRIDFRLVHWFDAASGSRIES